MALVIFLNKYHTFQTRMTINFTEDDLIKGWIRINVGQNSISPIKAPIGLKVFWNRSSTIIRLSLVLSLIWIFYPFGFLCFHYISYHIYDFGKKTGVDILEKRSLWIQITYAQENKVPYLCTSPCLHNPLDLQSLVYTSSTGKQPDLISGL